MGVVNIGGPYVNQANIVGVLAATFAVVGAVFTWRSNVANIPATFSADWKNAEEKNILSARQEGNPEGTAILNPFYHDIPSPDALKNL